MKPQKSSLVLAHGLGMDGPQVQLGKALKTLVNDNREPLRSTAYLTLIKVVRNITNAPTDERLCRIRLEGEKVQSKLIGALGVSQALAAIGFCEHSHKDGRAKVLVLPSSVAMNAPHMNRCLQVLLNMKVLLDMPTEEQIPSRGISNASSRVNLKPLCLEDDLEWQDVAALTIQAAWRKHQWWQQMKAFQARPRPALQVSTASVVTPRKERTKQRIRAETEPSTLFTNQPPVVFLTELEQTTPLEPELPSPAIAQHTTPTPMKGVFSEDNQRAQVKNPLANDLQSFISQGKSRGFDNQRLSFEKSGMFQTSSRKMTSCVTSPRRNQETPSKGAGILIFPELCVQIKSTPSLGCAVGSDGVSPVSSSRIAPGQVISSSPQPISLKGQSFLPAVYASYVSVPSPKKERNEKENAAPTNETQWNKASLCDSGNSNLKEVLDKEEETKSFIKIEIIENPIPSITDHPIYSRRFIREKIVYSKPVTSCKPLRKLQGQTQVPVTHSKRKSSQKGDKCLECPPVQHAPSWGDTPDQKEQKVLDVKIRKSLPSNLLEPLLLGQEAQWKEIVSGVQAVHFQKK